MATRKAAAKGCSPLGGDVAQEAQQERGVCFRLLDIFFLWKKEQISSMHHYSGGDLFCLLYLKLLKMEIQKMKSIFQTLTPSVTEKKQIFSHSISSRYVI